MFYAPWYVFDTQRNFETMIYTKKFVCVFCNRCGHCKKLKPEFEKAAKSLLKEDPPVTLAKVYNFYLITYNL